MPNRVLPSKFSQMSWRGHQFFSGADYLNQPMQQSADFLECRVHLFVVVFFLAARVAHRKFYVDADLVRQAYVGVVQAVVVWLYADLCS